MKKFFTILSIFLLSVAFCTSNVSARSVPLSNLSGIFGDWYDSNGNHVLRIGNDYTLNGYKITALDYEADSAGCYKVTFSKSLAGCLHTGHIKSSGISSPTYSYPQIRQRQTVFPSCSGFFWQDNTASPRRTAHATKTNFFIFCAFSQRYHYFSYL